MPGRERGGRGPAETAPPRAPGSSINYYESTVEKLGGVSKVEGSYRLFMVPGMGHCGGGEGATNFDMLTALEAWREHDEAPEKVIATKYASNTPASGIAMTHPLCPYPQTAQYKGRGDTKDAANFVCAVPKESIKTMGSAADSSAWPRPDNYCLSKTRDVSKSPIDALAWSAIVIVFPSDDSV